MPVVMVRAALLVGAIILVMTPAMLAPTSESLQVRTSAGVVVWCTPVNQGDTVQLQFTHSMYGGYVREQWLVTSNLQLERIWFVTENAAAAEYYATDGSSYKAEDGYVVPIGLLVEPELVVRVNSRGNHILTVDDQSVNLAELIAISAQVRITVERESCP